MAATTVLMDLPAVAGRGALRMGLMAQRLAPTDLPAAGRERDAAWRRFVKDPHAVAFVDISHVDPAAVPALLQLDAAVPRDDTRQRIVLTRLAAGQSMGHVSEADGRWVRRLGFADLIPELDPRDREGGLRTALDVASRTLGLAPLAADDLTRYARVMEVERDAASPRAVIRSLCGMSAEALATLLQDSLDITDRSYRLQRYPQCFVGRDAVAWLARHLRRSPSEAVAIGQSLMALGLLVHVVHEQPFLDDHLFFRLALSPAADALDLGEALARLAGPKGVPVADRMHLGKAYSRCWVGSEAVDRLVAWKGLQRHDAWVMLHRLMQFGLIEHVAHARPLIDGHFFYRFTGLPGGGARP